MRALRQFGCGLALCCAGRSACNAQAPAATGVLAGVVLDPSGARVAHAVVHVVSHADDSLPLDSATDELGRFSVRVLPGEYDVSSRSAGFQPAEVDHVAIRAGAHVELRLRLAIDGPAEVVNVTPENRVSTAAGENGSALLFDQDRLAELSNDNATLKNQLLALAGGNPMTAADLYVDGFSGGQIPPKSSIRQIRINQNPYSAQYPGYGMNRIEIFTSPGGAQFHGGLDANGDNAPWDAKNPYALVEAPYYAYYLDGHLSGPVGKKASFFAGGFFHNLENNAVVDAINPQSLASLSEAVPAPDRAHNYSTRIDRQMTAADTLTARYEYNSETVHNAGVGLLVLPSEGYTSRTTSQTLQLGETQVYTAKLIGESRFQYIRRRLFESANDSSPTVTVQGSFNGGGSSLGLLHDNQDRFEFQQLFSIDEGKHYLRAGARYVLLRDANSSTANYNGTYTFSDLTAYQLIRAGESLQQVQAIDPSASTQYSVTTGVPQATVLTGWLGAYGEDEWRVRRSLTLHYGLRFESQSAVPEHANWAPRVGFGWAVGQTGKKPPLVVLRGGFGVFFTRFDAQNILTAVRQNGVSQQTRILDDPSIWMDSSGHFELSPGQGGMFPPTTYTINPALKTEYHLWSGISADRSLGRKGSLSIQYSEQRGVHQYLSRNRNAPLPGTYLPGVPGSGVHPLGSQQAVYEFDSGGVLRAHAAFVNWNMRLSPRLFFYAVYFAQQTKSDTDGATTFPSNQFAPGADYGRAATDVTQRCYVSGTLNLPWQVSVAPLMAVGSGSPFDITTGTDLNGDTLFNDRPAFATDWSRASVVKTRYGTFDTQPMAGQRIIPRYYGVGPSYLSVQLSAGKTLVFGPRHSLPAQPAAPGHAPVPPGKSDAPFSLRLGVEAQNVFNNVSPGPPVGVLNSPLFGKPDSLQQVFSPNPAANRTLLLTSSFNF